MTKCFINIFPFRLGLSDHSYSNVKRQYVGSIANINIFFNTSYFLENLSKAMCMNTIDAKFSWTQMRWTVEGVNVHELYTSLQKICSNKTTNTLTLPMMWTLAKAKDACSKLNGGYITELTVP